ncbi:hypothetical protein NDU88_001540 [Pleurodeles waltl]|uniref:Uncharacterized protein n=1 Tax=Pleurodeles waltl TaxID=8319 RepID=A0AAV7SZT7_PLEWA|nr:hypothetical protein NDU88_001540 [Pleurodeles waltl]
MMLDTEPMLSLPADDAGHGARAIPACGCCWTRSPCYPCRRMILDTEPMLSLPADDAGHGAHAIPARG